MEQLEVFIPQMLSKMHIECLIHGNANKEKALKLVEIVEGHMLSTVKGSPLLPRQLLLNRELKLESGCNYVYEVNNEVHKSSCIELYYQCGLQSKEINMVLELIAQIIQEPCFNKLRTQVTRYYYYIIVKYSPFLVLGCSFFKCFFPPSLMSTIESLLFISFSKFCLHLHRAFLASLISSPFSSL